jgi:citrate lyase beta subunit
LRHFAYLNDDERADIFAVAPQPVTPDSPRDLIALALGATLYAPGTRANLDSDALRAGSVGSTSMVWCLEDAIPHDAVGQAEENIVAALKRLHLAEQKMLGALPLLFVRVRTAEQITRLAAEAGDAIRVLTGFSLPKTTPTSGREMLTAIAEVSKGLGRPMYAMPILESPELAYIETRHAMLRDLAVLFEEFHENVLCVRVGGTDLSGLFGLRRDRDTTIWDVAVVRDMLADILNQFARHGNFVVTGAVWEHIPGQRLFKPKLRESPFRDHGGQDARHLRMDLIKGDVDSLMREISKDKNNGMYGKTVIHPSHVSIVNSMLTVNREEYDDALAVKASAATGGVIASAHGRMNEMGPHALWAEQITARAAVYGVLASEHALVDLLMAGQAAHTGEYHSKSDNTAAAVEAMHKAVSA